MNEQTREVSHPNISWPKQELSVEIRFFNYVHVSNEDMAPVTTPKTHHGKVLDVFTAYCSSTNLSRITKYIITCIAHGH